jgi:hypothetical protein
VGDIDAAVVVDSLKVLDPKRPIREADVAERQCLVRKMPIVAIGVLLMNLSPVTEKSPCTGVKWERARA